MYIHLNGDDNDNREGWLPHLTAQHSIAQRTPILDIVEENVK